ncbi:MAG TPA: hypothetical protein VF181_05305 [Balneolaceae bacterium]
MKKVLRFCACSALVLSLYACDPPQAPDFKLESKLQFPLTVEQTYQFLGGSGALIDTTGENFDSLFTVDNNGLIRLSKEEDFDFGDLNDAIPKVNVDPATVVSEVGEISLANFSSSGSIGSASFESITGFSAPLQQGDPVPAASTPGTINIDFNTDYFVSAIIKNNGSLELTVTNNLGFDIDNLSITLNSGSSFVGNTAINPFNHNATETGTISIPAGTQLSDLNINISASWSAQTMKENADNLVVNSVRGQNLAASQVSAAIESQQFSSSGTTNVDDNKFLFTQPGHFIGLSNGLLSIDITNQINIAIESLDISFPDIRSKSTDTPLILSMNNIPSELNGGSFSTSFDLSGYRIYALDNEVTYNIDAITENTQQGAGSQIRTINEADELRASVELSNLEIKRATGVIIPRNVLLNNDAAANGANKLDVFNDDEAEVIKIDGISDLSEQISDITFANPILNIIYETNLTVDATVYAIIAGINSDGNTVYLSGKPGSNFYVSSFDAPSELMANNRPPDEEQLIKFILTTSPDGSTAGGIARFDSSGTNASEFFSNLPSKIRFVGIARINEDGSAETETISTPITFDPRLSVDLPLNFSAENASFSDTLDADLSNLPGEGDEQQLSEAIFTINYTNGLPFGLDLSLIMLNENGDEVTSYPLNGQEPLMVQAASIDPVTGFVEDGGAKTGKLQISLTAEQLELINQTRSMILKINFNTAQQREVKVRAEDSVMIRMKMSVDVISAFN